MCKLSDWCEGSEVLLDEAKRLDENEALYKLLVAINWRGQITIAICIFKQCRCHLGILHHIRWLSPFLEPEGPMRFGLMREDL